jgi:hypothetical protein
MMYGVHYWCWMWIIFSGEWGILMGVRVYINGDTSGRIWR